MRTLMRLWIRVWDVHGKRHNISRHVTLEQMIKQGIGC